MGRTRWNVGQGDRFHSSNMAENVGNWYMERLRTLGDKATVSEFLESRGRIFETVGGVRDGESMRGLMDQWRKTVKKKLKDQQTFDDLCETFFMDLQDPAAGDQSDEKMRRSHLTKSQRKREKKNKQRKRKAVKNQLTAPQDNSENIAPLDLVGNQRVVKDAVKMDVTNMSFPENSIISTPSDQVVPEIVKDREPLEKYKRRDQPRILQSLSQNQNTEKTVLTKNQKKNKKKRAKVLSKNKNVGDENAALSRNEKTAQILLVVDPDGFDGKTRDLDGMHSGHDLKHPSEAQNVEKVLLESPIGDQFLQGRQDGHLKDTTAERIPEDQLENRKDEQDFNMAGGDAKVVICEEKKSEMGDIDGPAITEDLETISINSQFNPDDTASNEGCGMKNGDGVLLSKTEDPPVGFENSESFRESIDFETVKSDRDGLLTSGRDGTLSDDTYSGDWSSMLMKTISTEREEPHESTKIYDESVSFGELLELVSLKSDIRGDSLQALEDRNSTVREVEDEDKSLKEHKDMDCILKVLQCEDERVSGMEDQDVNDKHPEKQEEVVQDQKNHDNILKGDGSQDEFIAGSENQMIDTAEDNMELNKSMNQPLSLVELVQFKLSNSVSLDNDVSSRVQLDALSMENTSGMTGSLIEDASNEEFVQPKPEIPNEFPQSPNCPLSSNMDELPQSTEELPHLRDEILWQMNELPQIQHVSSQQPDELTHAQDVLPEQTNELPQPQNASPQPTDELPQIQNVLPQQSDDLQGSLNEVVLSKMSDHLSSIPSDESIRGTDSVVTAEGLSMEPSSEGKSSLSTDGVVSMRSQAETFSAAPSSETPCSESLSEMDNSISSRAESALGYRDWTPTRGDSSHTSFNGSFSTMSAVDWTAWNAATSQGRVVTVQPLPTLNTTGVCIGDDVTESSTNVSSISLREDPQVARREVVSPYCLTELRFLPNPMRPLQAIYRHITQSCRFAIEKVFCKQDKPQDSIRKI